MEIDVVASEMKNSNVWKDTTSTFCVLFMTFVKSTFYTVQLNLSNNNRHISTL